LKFFATTTLIALAFVATSALATPIGTGLNGETDFRNGSTYSTCDSTTGCTKFDAATGMNVTITANPTNTGGLYWDSTDGFGVRGGENDEIDKLETLTVTFASSVNLAGVWFTDLFMASDGGGDGETAKVTLYLGASNLGSFTFNANEPAPNVNNGERYGSFGSGVTVNKIVFSAMNQCNDEYSVAGLVTNDGRVPEPGTIILLGVGLVFLGALRRRAKA
jgi:hypothetical protein